MWYKFAAFEKSWRCITATRAKRVEQIISFALEAKHMSTQLSSDTRLLSLAGEILAAYVSNNHLQMSDLPRILTDVHRALSELHTVRHTAPVPAKASAQQVARSITPDFLISFEDGKPYKTLRRHLALHGLTPEAYRTKWGLEPDYPMTAPSYSKRRSELARALGLGRQHRPAQRSAAQVTELPRSRGRSLA